MDFKTSTYWPDIWKPTLYLKLRQSSSPIPYELNTIDNGTIITLNSSVNQGSLGGSNQYRFDKIFEPEKPDDEINSTLSFACINDLFKGYNSTYISYGQTGTGKTYTLYGTAFNDTPTDLDSKNINTNKNVKNDSNISSNSNIQTSASSNKSANSILQKKNYGLISKVGNDLFEMIDQIRAIRKGITFLVNISFVEVYKEEVYDLLQHDDTLSNKKLSLHHDMDKYQGLDIIKNVKSVTILDRNELNDLIDSSRRLLHSCHNNGIRSSTILRIKLLQLDEDEDLETQSTICFVDLAGSDRASKDIEKGITREAASKYNRVMDSLNSMVYTLANSESISINKSIYRNSHLTRILYDLLAGNHKTNLIFSCSLNKDDEYETFSTLGFSSYASSMSNQIKINQTAIGGDKKRAILTDDWNLMEEYYRNRIELLKDELHEVSMQNVMMTRGMQTLEQSERENEILRDQLNSLVQLIKTPHSVKGSKNIAREKKFTDETIINSVMEQVAAIADLQSVNNDKELENINFTESHIMKISMKDKPNYVEQLHDTESKMYRALTDFSKNQILSDNINFNDIKGNDTYLKKSSNKKETSSLKNNDSLDKLVIPKTRTKNTSDDTNNSDSSKSNNSAGDARRVKSERGWSFFRSKKSAKRSVTVSVDAPDNSEPESDPDARIEPSPVQSELQLKMLKISAGLSHV
ncbi:hypothetical protein TBLA_0C00800 [Henningerozyma blattae CBS 6284]|uniref:Kinesin motor domain-containing protein n=1 Tax=Henningerozyma blattae (strain ATCC 34711 / CBS 6284 / DSM 70876 / NBRC 10599 / NRRL Y-10934 / UCD 77-7) TaxID=1071380 RepID=I2H0J3_HENB6|nr:hypothetical protein TBLA_0C00800 [Tetrapisispora blattae CBS 6284]CCH59895.1 hypothetical protein TBLA_0C00800 [Tetrapisispora blattae CBS 6284]